MRGTWKEGELVEDYDSELKALERKVMTPE